MFIGQMCISGEPSVLFAGRTEKEVVDSVKLKRLINLIDLIDDDADCEVDIQRMRQLSLVSSAEHLAAWFEDFESFYSFVIQEVEA